MKIKDILAQNEVTISFEVFPPKVEEKLESTTETARKIAALGPVFMSVTYGANGGASEYSAQIATEIENNFNVPVLAHLSCVSTSTERIHELVEIYKANNIENIMALRGDIPKDGRLFNDFEYASDLVSELKRLYPEVCIGGACYPEGHIECERPSDDLNNLKKKVDAGCDFLTTQMFFDNNTMYNFMYRLREAGIEVPVLAGIMPITNVKQVSRSVALSGASIPQRFRMMVDKFGHDPAMMKQAGIIYATEQIIDLISNGIGHIHVYTMNKPDVTAGIMNSLSEIAKL